MDNCGDTSYLDQLYNFSVDNRVVMWPMDSMYNTSKVWSPRAPLNSGPGGPSTIMQENSTERSSVHSRHVPSEPPTQQQTSDEFRALATHIRDNCCEPAEVFEVQIQTVLKLVFGKQMKRDEAVKSGMIEALASSLRRAGAAQYRLIVQLLAELTTELRYYPTTINDSLYFALASILVDHPECVDYVLGTLCELTRFDQGRCSALNAKIPRTLGMIIEHNQRQDIVVPALRILANIADNGSFAQALLSANVFVAFRKAAERLLLKAFHESSASDPRALNLLWTASMCEDPMDRDRLIRQVMLDCREYCAQALQPWQPIMTEWSNVMQLSAKSMNVLLQAKDDFLYNAFVLLRYGNDECIRYLPMTLSHISRDLSPIGKIDIINANIIDALLERYPIQRICNSLLTTVEQSQSIQQEVPPERSIVTVLLLIKLVLKDLPARRDPAVYTNNVVEALQRYGLNRLAVLGSMNASIQKLLVPLLTLYDGLSGWISPKRQTANLPVEQVHANFMSMSCTMKNNGHIRA